MSWPGRLDTPGAVLRHKLAIMSNDPRNMLNGMHDRVVLAFTEQRQRVTLRYMSWERQGDHRYCDTERRWLTEGF